MFDSCMVQEFLCEVLSTALYSPWKCGDESPLRGLRTDHWHTGTVTSPPMSQSTVTRVKTQVFRMILRNRPSFLFCSLGSVFWAFHFLHWEKTHPNIHHFKECTVLCSLVYSWGHVTLTTNSYYFHHLRKKPCAHQQSLPSPLFPQVLATPNLLFVCMNLPLPNTSYKWNHTIKNL